MTFDHIVVALRSPGDDDALLEFAARLARLGATKSVRLVHVAEAGEPAAALRDQMRAQAAPVFAGLGATVECDVLQGALTDRLLAYVEEFQADVIVIGSKRRKLGARLAMIAPCSVAIVPVEHRSDLTHLVVAFDFSEGSTETVRWATRLVAADPSIRCTALHVETNESTDLFGDTDDADEATTMRHMLQAAGDPRVAIETRRVGVARTTDVGVSHRFSFAASIEGSDVAHTILAEAQALGADCLALSTRGRSRSASILLGSVTEKVIERATMPLLVGKHTGRNLGLVSILLGQARRDAGIKTN